ncbi:MAG: EutN/CcmL family microcompartment protein [Candidatus Eisenbacteria bacterium]
MIIGRVTGSLYSTINHPILDYRKLLVVEKLAPDGTPLDDYLVAIDTVDAGVGQIVLMIDEGNSARQVLAAPNAPTRSIIVGIIDAIDIPDADPARRTPRAGGPAGTGLGPARPKAGRSGKSPS